MLADVCNIDNNAFVVRKNSVSLEMNNRNNLMAKKKHKTQGGQQFLSDTDYLKQRMRSVEIGTCYISPSIHELGLGHVVVTRRHTGGNVSVGCYFVDTFCLGVKDSFYRLRMTPYEFSFFMKPLEREGVEECSYEEAHNWIYGAIDFAEEGGIKPDKSFALTKYILEEDTDDVPLIEYEFGKDGQHFLAVDSELEASKYLPTLRKTLGDDFDFMINDDLDDFDEDYEDEFDDMEDDDWDMPRSGTDALVDMPYTYKHPPYPSTCTIKHEWLLQELGKKENAFGLKDELTDRILTLPKEESRQDLEQILAFNLGLTCDEDLTDGDDEEFIGIVGSCILLLGEVGNSDSSLDLVLEMMRQSPAFYEYHFGDFGPDILVPTLNKLGQHRIDKLLDYCKEAGLYTYAKCQAITALASIGVLQPDRRDEIVGLFRELLVFATEHLAENTTFTPTLTGLMTCDVMDLQARELLPELKNLYDTRLVDEGIAGHFSEIEKQLTGQLPMLIGIQQEMDIRKIFARMRTISSD